MAFKFFDQDCNGKITLDELKRVFDGGVTIHNAHDDYSEVWDKILEEVDLDHDGTISYNEFYNEMVGVLQMSYEPVFRIDTISA